MKSLSAIWKKVLAGFAGMPGSETGNESAGNSRQAYRSASSERDGWQYNPAPRHHSPAADCGNTAQRQLCSTPLKDQNSIFY